MLKIELQIKRANLTARMHAKLMREINRRWAERQWSERVPKHFEMVGYSEYGFRQRSSKYNENKLKKKYVGHTRPNVRTGNLKRRLKSKITATQNGARLSMSSSLDKKIDPDEWAAMTQKQKSAHVRKQRRLANWQKRELAVMSRKEIGEERKRQASEYKRGATSPEYRRQRTRRIK
jgi:hypothetical protein